MHAVKCGYEGGSKHLHDQQAQRGVVVVQLRDMLWAVPGLLPQRFRLKSGSFLCAPHDLFSIRPIQDRWPLLRIGFAASCPCLVPWIYILFRRITCLRQ